jgi:hypothetical protein
MLCEVLRHELGHLQLTGTIDDHTMPGMRPGERPYPPCSILSEPSPREWAQTATGARCVLSQRTDNTRIYGCGAKRVRVTTQGGVVSKVRVLRDHEIARRVGKRR